MTVMRRPALRSIIPGITALAQLSTPYRLTPIQASHESRSASQKGLRETRLGSAPMLPALLTRISTAPISLAARSTMAWTASRSVTSASTGSARQPSPSTSLATASARSR
jgi:hypothetical protein